MKRDAELLDCTIRDGNYAVNFKFTEHDTEVLVAQLARLGFRWIEVGHGLGLGGTEAGKGEMVASDAAFIRAAKKVAGDAKVGSFFIPGIGDKERMREARDAGLDFIRIGQNAPQIHDAFPFVEEARRLGMIPCINMMKSYGVTPDRFGELTRDSAEAGAEVVYCVDSAGSMFPSDVRNYFSAARERTSCRLGFHGHNNLMMVIENCLEAHRCGVEFLDVTLAGLGRSAGNAPAEILVAVCRKLNLETGIDLFELMDVVETYMWPLVSRMRAHDMLGVAGGYAQFHSSFLPQVARAARENHAELRRLVVRVAEHDPVDLDKEYLKVAARELSGTAQSAASKDLVTFQSGAFSPDRLSMSSRSLEDLVRALTATSSKNVGSLAALHLVPTTGPESDLLAADFVLSDDQWSLGRVVYGSMQTLEHTVRHAWPRVDLFLVSLTEGWAGDALSRCAALTGPDRVVPVRDDALQLLHLQETLDGLLVDRRPRSVLVYGMNDPLERALSRWPEEQPLYLCGVREMPGLLRRHVVNLGGWQDWGGLQLRFDLLICAAAPDADEARQLVRALDDRADVLLLDGRAREAGWAEMGLRVRLFHPDVAYAGILQRHLARQAGTRLQREEF